MIWHLFEVWLVMLAAFLVGCAMGALAYELIARSRYATVQGVIADAFGDALDRVKDRFGVEPVWRPRRRRIVAPPVSRPRPASGDVDHRPLSDDQGIPAVWDEGAVDEMDHDNIAGKEREPAVAAVAGSAGGEAKTAGEATVMPTVTPGAVVAKRPVSLAEPRNGVPDNLQRIRGIGERNEMRLNALGIYHFGQIASWTPAEILWVSQQLAFPERIERDDWVGQAIVLASGGDTGFTKSAERRRARRRQQESRKAEHHDDDA